MPIKLMFTAFAAAAVMSAAPALGSGGGLEQRSSYALRIEGYVPVICRVSVDTAAAPALDGVVDLGRMTEFCNSARGYQVWVDHAPGLEGAALRLDGRRVALSPTGSTLVSNSGTAAFRSHRLGLESDGHPAVLSMRVVAL